MGLGPLDMMGGPFLLLYAVLFVIAVMAGFLLAEWLRPDGSGGGLVTGADELAYLACGRVRLAEATITHLMAEREIELTDKGALRMRPTPAQRSAAERRVLALASPAKWKDAVAALQDEASVIDARLVRRGLLMDAASRAQHRFWQVMPYGALFLFGAAKWGVGTMRDRPVGFLTMALVVTAACGIIRFVTARPFTRAGQAVVIEARRSAERMRSAHRQEEAGLAVALFGTAVLAGSSLSDFHRMRSQGGSGDGGSSDSGGDGGCGGGGCGGCGS
ncbi:MAG: TIGR04222 domain-containing membrane protein [Sphingomonadales bacterium]|nr:TIGR04222 domain-containing membrane protein [Sphingomonadales bacterium]